MPVPDTFTPLVIRYPPPPGEASILYREYFGSTSHRTKDSVTAITTSHSGGRISKTFNWSKFGGVVNAKEAAEKYRKLMSDNYDLTLTIYRHYFASHIKELTAGFFDGDGCIDVHCSIRVRFTQAGIVIPGITLFFQSLYGGVIETIKRKSATTRDAYNLTISGVAALPLLDILREKSIVKREQACLGIEFTLSKDTMYREYCKKRIKDLKKEYHLITIDKTRLTNAYIAGLFDAEGCVSYAKQITIYCTLAQKSSLHLLHAINERWNLTGRVDPTLGVVVRQSLYLQI
jgi:hypothetical protein